MERLSTSIRLRDIGTSYDFEIVTKDGKIISQYKLGISLSSMLLNLDDPYSDREPDTIDWVHGTIIEVLGAADKKVQNYITHLRKKLKESSSEEVKKQLEVLENAAAIVVRKKPCFTRHY
jgi:hypothetical protein